MHRKDIKYDDSNKDLKELDMANMFEYAKPVDYIRHFIRAYYHKDALIVDFFSGGSTTAHAVLAQNAEDGGTRQYIMVQVAQETDKSHPSYKFLQNLNKAPVISELAKERIRRAGAKIAEANRLTAPNLDIGFRVLKVDSTNMKPVFYNPEDPILTQEFLSTLESNIKEDRTAEDLLFQVMLDMGIDLSSDIVVETVASKKIYIVGGDNLICCFDEGITKEVVTAIANKKPLFAVFRDSSFKDDSTMVSFEQIFETYSPTTERRVI